MVRPGTPKKEFAIPCAYILFSEKFGTYYKGSTVDLENCQ